MRKPLAAGLAAAAFGTVTAAAPAIAASASSPGPATAPGASGQATATVSVLHGVPGLTADIYAGNKKILSNVAPGSLTPPMKLPAGGYDIRIFKAGAAPNGTPAVSKTVQVAAGSNDTITAHLTESGQPAITAYVNDTSRLPAGKARLTVRHIAQAPAVDIWAGGKPVVQGLSNPDQAKLEVPTGTVKTNVVLAGTNTAVVWPANLTFSPGTSTIVYAWGSAPQRYIKLAVQTIKGLQTAPSGVPAGTGGQAAQSGGEAPVWLYGLTGVALLVTIGAGSRLVILRRRG